MPIFTEKHKEGKMENVSTKSLYADNLFFFFNSPWQSPSLLHKDRNLTPHHTDVPLLFGALKVLPKTMAKKKIC